LTIQFLVQAYSSCFARLIFTKGADGEAVEEDAGLLPIQPTWDKLMSTLNSLTSRRNYFMKARIWELTEASR